MRCVLNLFEFCTANFNSAPFKYYAAKRTLGCVAKKFMSLGEAETKRGQAIQFLERVGGDSGKFEEMDAKQYAESRGFQVLENPQPQKVVTTMTKQEMAETLDQASDLVDEALDPELTREELVGKMKELSDLISGEEPDEDEDQDGEEEA